MNGKHTASVNGEALVDGAQHRRHSFSPDQTGRSAMKRRILWSMSAALMVLGVALHPGPAIAADAQATIDNFSFTPPMLTVSVGTKVTWTNRDDIPHTVTDADHPRDIRSHPLDTGDSYSRTFTAAGTYHYFCSLHPHMQGTVVVK
jgi:plastocyanin